MDEVKKAVFEDVNLKNIISECVTENGDKVLHFCAKFNKADSFRFFAKQLAAKLDSTNHAGETPLMFACREGKM